MCCAFPGSATSSVSPCSGSIWTQLLVVGVPFGGWAVLATLVAATGVCGAVGVRRGRSVPRGLVGPPTGSSLSLFVTASGIALVGLLLEALFRSARLQSLQAFDAWAFWVPKAKAIYFFGGLDEQIFTTSAGPTYPPIVPILDAAAFHAMGSVEPSSRSTSSSGSSWRAASRRSPGASTGTCLPGHCGRHPCSSWSSLASARGPDAAGRRARRPALRGRRAAAHTLATRRSGVAPHVHRSPLFAGCRSDEARRACSSPPSPSE